MADCLIGLGSNLCDRTAQLDNAIEQFCGHPQIDLRATSAYCQTRPVGGPPDQQAYVNAAIRITTQLSPSQLLLRAHQIEQRMGRQRAARWGPRVIDIDLLLYDHLFLDTPDLTLPHPRMAVRRFVLEPASQIAPDMLHVPTGWTIKKLLEQLCDAPTYIAMAGPPGAGKTEVARALANACGADLVLDEPAESLVGGAARLFQPDLARELARLEDRRKHLASAVSRTQGDRKTILVSDFWLSQTLVAARAWFEGSNRQQLERACHAALRKLPLPKLVMFLDTPLSVLRQRRPLDLDSRQARQLEANLTRFHQLLHGQVVLPGQGPILRVADGDSELAMVEAVAAVAAMA